MTQQFNEFIGQPLEVLEEAAKKDGFTVRITHKDGRPMVVTRDVQNKRLNVATVSGLVTLILGVG
jgi:hypothetical protein